ncbi:MAG: sensor histidine kinase [Candidatus Hydrogenedentota bacterium]
MKLAFKLILTVLLTLIVIRSIEGVMTVRRETHRLNEDIRRDTELFGRILGASVRTAWIESGRAKALDLIDQFNVEGHPVEISWETADENGELAAELGEGALAKLKAGNNVSLRHEHSRHGPVRYSYIPVMLPEVNGVIRLREMLEERSRYVRNALFREVAAGSAVVVAGGGVMMLLGLVLIGRPLRRLQHRIERIGDGDLEGRIAFRGHDELSALAAGLNDMCAKLSASRQRELAETQKRIEALEQMRHMDRLTTIGRLASGVAHELGTPLNVIVGRAGMLADGTIAPGSDKAGEVARTIKMQGERMTSIIQRLLDFARQRQPERAAVNAVDIVRQTVELVDCLGYQSTVRVDWEGDAPDLVAQMDPVQMQQVLTNLIENALQAMPEGGDALITVRSAQLHPPAGSHLPAGWYLQIAVQDEGIGIAQENVASVFDPFFTTKDVGDGTGLGLSITYNIVREHGGWIDVSSEEGAGSCFTINIPQEINAREAG